MLVVFDANIWRSEFGLNTSLGAATRYFLLQKGAVLLCLRSFVWRWSIICEAI